MDYLTFIQTYNTEESCILLWKNLRDKTVYSVTAVAVVNISGSLQS